MYRVNINIYGICRVISMVILVHLFENYSENSSHEKTGIEIRLHIHRVI